MCGRNFTDVNGAHMLNGLATTRATKIATEIAAVLAISAKPTLLPWAVDQLQILVADFFLGPLWT